MDEQSTHQPEPPPDSSGLKRASAFAWLVWPVILLLLYVLSFGPAVSLAAKSRSTSLLTVVSTIYFPIFRFCEACQPAETGLNWYLYKFGQAAFFHWNNHEIIFFSRGSYAGSVCPPPGPTPPASTPPH